MHVWAEVCSFRAHAERQIWKRSDPDQTSRWERGLKKRQLQGHVGFISTSCCSRYRRDAFKSPEGFTRLHFDHFNENSAAERKKRRVTKDWMLPFPPLILHLINRCKPVRRGGNQRGSLHFPPVFLASSLNTNGIFPIFHLPDVS